MSPITRRTCGDAGGTKKNGDPCPVTANLGESGFCPWHDPDTTRLQAMRSAGGRAKGLAVESLGQLETVEDATRWTRLVGMALAREDITPNQANALMRVIAQWHKNEDLRLRRDDLRDLERQVRDLRRQKGAPSDA
jgi:hypothetical protein